MTTKLEREEMTIWFADEEEEAVRLKRKGECVVFLLTETNRHIFIPGITYCVEGCPEEVPEDYLRRVWQRHRGLPWHILDTERLTLREMTEADLDALYEIQGGEESSGFMDRLETDRHRQLIKMKEYIRSMYGFYGYGIWMAVLKESGQAIGRVGLQIREGCEEPELGFAIAPGFRGRGFAYEACRAALDYAFEKLDFSAVRAVAHRGNKASLGLCEKLGFVVDKCASLPGDMWIGMIKVRQTVPPFPG